MRYVPFVLALALACVCAAGANASQLIDRNAHDVRLAVEREGRGADHLHGRRGRSSTCSPGTRSTRSRRRMRARRLRSGSTTRVAGAARTPRPGRRSARSCGAYDGPALAWKVAACKAPDGSYWALQAWQRMLPNYGVAPSAAQAAWELRLSHWTGDAAGADDRHRLGLAPVGSPLRHVHLRGQARLRLQVDARRATRSTRSAGTSTSTRSTRPTAPAGSARTASSRTAAPGSSVTASTRTARIRPARAPSTARRSKGPASPRT